MLYDVRTYTCKPGKLKPHLALYEQQGKAAQTRCLGEPILFLVSETGNVNQYLHIWAYRDVGDRAEKRQQLMQDKDWLSYLQASAELDGLQSQDSKLMHHVDFFHPPCEDKSHA